MPRSLRAAPRYLAVGPRRRDGCVCTDRRVGAPEAIQLWRAATKTVALESNATPDHHRALPYPPASRHPPSRASDAKLTPPQTMNAITNDATPAPINVAHHGAPNGSVRPVA